MSQKYLLTLRWSWGKRNRFQEEARWTVYSKDEVPQIIKPYLISIANKYTYDCGDVTHPLYPSVDSISVTPIEETEYLDTFEYSGFLDERVELVMARKE